MKHLKAISIKFLVIAIVLYSILTSFYSASLLNIFIISVLVTGVAYVVGDLFILPRFGNLIATIADFGLAFGAIWLLSVFFLGLEYGIVAASLFCAILISLTEALFHIYMDNKVLHNGDEEIYVDRYQTSRQLQTEFSEENPDIDIIELKKKKDGE
ncbi:YndM family protein [Aquibacillus albus]|uniref:Type III secretory pathway component EscS n=1 Tax=Aquibacillus albus TaxID=1168171 RepID=A0ABS2MYL5_9BACI|nr:YndM family protein [Aquibacillus albus]MBM7571003.1 type III secretory pathway component EscS [Aquibacillus albus]